MGMVVDGSPGYEKPSLNSFLQTDKGYSKVAKAAFNTAYAKNYKGSSCSGLSVCRKRKASATKTARSFTAKFEKCDKLNSALAAQMAANAKMEAAMRGKLAKAKAALTALEAAAKIRKE